MRILKIGLKPTQNKHVIHHFGGMLALKSGLRFFCFGAGSAIFGYLKTGTFAFCLFRPEACPAYASSRSFAIFSLYQTHNEYYTHQLYLLANIA